MSIQLESVTSPRYVAGHVKAFERKLIAEFLATHPDRVMRCETRAAQWGLSPQVKNPPRG